MALVAFGDKVSTNQTFTATTVSTDAMDLKKVRDIGEGQPIIANIAMSVAPTTAGTASIVFEVIISSAAALNANIITLVQSRSYTYAELQPTAGTGAPLGKTVALTIPPNMFEMGWTDVAPYGQQDAGDTLRPYIGIRYTVTTGTGTLTNSAWNAYFSPSTRGDSRKFYPSGYTL